MKFTKYPKPMRPNQYVEWLDGVARKGIQLTPEGAFTLLDLVGIVEDACIEIGNLLEHQPLTSFERELTERREMWQSDLTSESNCPTGSEDSSKSQELG